MSFNRDDYIKLWKFALELNRGVTKKRQNEIAREMMGMVESVIGQIRLED
jgi:hypothetical protein